MQQAIYKVPNGKLLKIFLDKSVDIIANVKITGDFFIYPEEKIAELEVALKGQKLDEKALQTTIENFIQTHHLELFGVDSESIAKTIIMAAENPPQTT